MTQNEARKILGRWDRAPDGLLEEAIAVLVTAKRGEDWLRGHPHVLKDPMEGQEDEFWGIHQRPGWNLMSYRKVRYEDSVLFLFDADIKDLIEKGE